MAEEVKAEGKLSTIRIQACSRQKKAQAGKARVKKWKIPELQGLARTW